MILNRLGNKTKIANEIQKYFPKHTGYGEMFFGAGGMFFNKPKVKYNFLNDLDDDVYNLYRQLIDNKEELVNALTICPITHTQFKEWGKGSKEQTELMNAVRFLILSNYGLYGKPNTLRTGFVNPKAQIIQNIESTFNFISDCYFFCVDFRKYFSKIDFQSNKDNLFVYADPPYLDTDNNYSSGFTNQDSVDLFKCLQDSGVKWAMSEFNHPFIIQQANDIGLFITEIGERQNINNRRTEILLTNYQPIIQHSIF